MDNNVVFESLELIKKILEKSFNYDFLEIFQNEFANYGIIPHLEKLETSSNEYISNISEELLNCYFMKDQE